MNIVTEIGKYPMATNKFCGSLCTENTAATRDKPNVDVVIADSGEVGHLDPYSTIPTDSLWLAPHGC